MLCAFEDSNSHIHLLISRHKTQQSELQYKPLSPLHCRSHFQMWKTALPLIWAFFWNRDLKYPVLIFNLNTLWQHGTRFKVILNYNNNWKHLHSEHTENVTTSSCLAFTASMEMKDSCDPESMKTCQASIYLVTHHSLAIRGGSLAHYNVLWETKSNILWERKTNLKIQSSI